MRQTRNLVYGFTVTWVRIPPSPPVLTSQQVPGRSLTSQFLQVIRRILVRGRPSPYLETAHLVDGRYVGVEPRQTQRWFRCEGGMWSVWASNAVRLDRRQFQTPLLHVGSKWACDHSRGAATARAAHEFALLREEHRSSCIGIRHPDGRTFWRSSATRKSTSATPGPSPTQMAASLRQRATPHVSTTACSRLLPTVRFKAMAGDAGTTLRTSA